MHIQPETWREQEDNEDDLQKSDDQGALSGHTDIVSIEKPSQKDHLKWFGHATENHE